MNLRLQSPNFLLEMEGEDPGMGAIDFIMGWETLGNSLHT